LKEIQSIIKSGSSNPGFHDARVKNPSPSGKKNTTLAMKIMREGLDFLSETPKPKTKRRNKK
jgi:hypothetical protein